jgi:hypothetical protein
MDLIARVDTVGFKKFCDDLAKISGRSFEDVVKAQAGSVLKRAMSKTKAADTAKLNERARKIAQLERGYFPQRDGSALIVGTRTKMRFWKDYSPKTDRPTIYPISNARLPNEVWDRYRSAVNRISPRMRLLAKKIKGAKGLAKSTWLNIAKDFGVENILKAPAYVQKAKSTSRKRWNNSDGSEFFTMADAFVVMRQRYKNLTKNGFAAIVLQAAIKARISTFSKDLKRGVFDDAKKRASRYPGVYVKQT